MPDRQTGKKRVRSPEGKPLKDNPEELKLTGSRYTLSDWPRAVIDTSTGKRYEIAADLIEEPAVRELVLDLIHQANRRVGDFDHLQSSSDAFQSLFRFLIGVFPTLFDSGAMQHLVDLFACLHDLVARHERGILKHRWEGFDGDYFWKESFDTALAEGKEPRIPSRVPIRLYRDMHEGKLILAYQIMLEVGDKDWTSTQMSRLLKEYSIRNVDDLDDYKVTARELDDWHTRLNDSDAPKGRIYSVHRLRILYEREIAECTDNKEAALSFARKMLQNAKRRQPTNIVHRGIA